MQRVSDRVDRFRSRLQLPRLPARLPARWPAPSLLLLLALALPAWGTAQDGLYGPEAPRDTAWVRLINANPLQDAILTVGNEEWPAVPFAEVSPYRQIAPGEHDLTLAGEEFRLAATPEGFFTVVALAGPALLLEDTPLRDISRGMLTLYNLTDDAPLALRTSGGSDVLADVPPRSGASVAISEAEVVLEVHRGGELFATLDSRLYRRGEAHAVIVLPPGSEPHVVYARAVAEP